jgi:hypothetical protein
MTLLFFTAKHSFMPSSRNEPSIALYSSYQN